MKKRGLTLVEILVVVGIIAVLISLLIPAMAATRAHSRTAACVNNLHQIGTALTEKVVKGLRPKAEAWPSVPMDSFPTKSMYLCPEVIANGENTATDKNFVLSKLMLLNTPRAVQISFADPSHQGSGKMYLGTNNGSDARGDYIDVGISDTSTVNFSGQNNNDPHDGWIRIYTNDGGTGRVVAKLLVYNCGEPNCVLYDGKPIFIAGDDPANISNPADPFYGWLGPPGSTKITNNMETEIVAAPCNYGMVKGSEKFTLADRIWVADYIETVIDPGLGDSFDKLDLSKRHRGKLNLLMNDCSVRQQTPDQIKPSLQSNKAMWGLDPNSSN